MSSEEELVSSSEGEEDDADDSPVEAAVLSRSRRKTAGARMTSLAGKAAEADAAFWSHETWNEEGGFGRSKADGSDDDDDGDGSSDSDEDGSGSISSGAGSYRLSDEDDEDRVDQFDSDFDRSEDEEDEEEAERRAAEREKEMQREERRSNKRGKAGAYVDIAASAGRELMKKRVGSKKAKSGKKVRVGMGDGANAGLVLNFPGAAPAGAPGIGMGARNTTGSMQAPPQLRQVVKKAPTPASAVPAAVVPSSPTTRRASRAKAKKKTATATKRTLRTATLVKSVETAASIKAASKQTAKRQALIASRQRANPVKKRFTQEELLIEAATVTEPENERWILGRKRIMEEAEMLQNTLHGKHHHRGGGGGGQGGDAKVISKFHSRRGCLNTITFPDMDMVPDVLSGNHKRHYHRHHHPGDGTYDPAVCVITGKKARYRDPKTMLGYHDIAAFKELRKRLESGELVDPRTSAGAVGDSKSKKRKARGGKGAGPIVVRIRMVKIAGGDVHATAIPAAAVVKSETKKQKVESSNTVQKDKTKPAAKLASSVTTAGKDMPGELSNENEAGDATTTDTADAAAVAAPNASSSHNATFDAKAAAREAASKAATEVVQAASAGSTPEKQGKGGPVSKHTIAAATAAAVAAAIRASTPPRKDGEQATTPQSETASASKPNGAAAAVAAASPSQRKESVSVGKMVNEALSKYRKVPEDEASSHEK